MPNLSEIAELIAQGNAETARDLLREIIKNEASAEAYFLAAEVALNDAQKRLFLEKALELDPFHAKAAEALEKLKLAVPSAKATLPQPVTQGLKLVERYLPIIIDYLKRIPTIIIAGTVPQRAILGAGAIVLLFGFFWLPRVFSNDDEAWAMAMKVLNNSYEEGLLNDRPQILSIQHANEAYGGYDESWCITFAPTWYNSGDGSFTSNLLITRDELLWYYNNGNQIRETVIPVLNPYTFESQFLQYGCSNWKDEGDYSDN